MKRTDMERKIRDLKRKEKKNKSLSEKIELRQENTVTSSGQIGLLIKALSGLFRYDEEEIYNLKDERILNILIDIKEQVPKSKWHNLLRKAIKSTKVQKKDPAFNQLKVLLED